MVKKDSIVIKSTNIEEFKAEADELQAQGYKAVMFFARFVLTESEANA